MDYFLRPKPAYFAIARELRPYTVGLSRKDVKTSTKPDSAAFFEIDTSVEVWGTNSTTYKQNVFCIFFLFVSCTADCVEAFQLQATLVIEAFDLHDKSFQWKTEKSVTLGPNRSSELWSGRVPGQEIRTKLSDVPRAIILSARLIDVYGDGRDVLARCANWYVLLSSEWGLLKSRQTYYMSLRPEPFKFVKFPSIQDVNLKITTSPVEDTDLETALERIRPFSRSSPDVENVTKITLSASLPIKGIVLDAEGSEDVKWSDQALDLVPGDEQVVFAWGLKGRVPTARYLGDGSA